MRSFVYIFAIKYKIIDFMDLQKTMKERRKTLSLSQRDLAEMSELSLATIKDIERGKGNPSIGTVEKILEVLGMEIVYRIRRTVNEE